MSSGKQPDEPKRRGIGYVYRQSTSRFWWIKYSWFGHVYRESSKQTDRRKAEKMLAARLAELHTGTFAGPKVERTTVTELADALLLDYSNQGRKSLPDVTTRWELHLKPFFGHLRAIEVTTDKLNEYIAARQTESKNDNNPLAVNGTINRELAALRRMFRLGARSTPVKVRHIPAFPHLKENRARQGFLDYSQYEKLAKVCSSTLWLRTLLECGYTYGWRISELLGLKVRQIDLAQRLIQLEESKNGEPRTAVMTDSVFHLLAACVTGKTPDDFVFTRGNKPVKDFRDTWKAVCKQAGVPNLLFHDLRRSSAKSHRRAGVAESVIMNIGGWKTAYVFRRYAIVDQSDILDAMNKWQASQAFQAAQQTAQGQDGHTDGHTEAATLSAEPLPPSKGEA